MESEISSSVCVANYLQWTQISIFQTACLYAGAHWALGMLTPQTGVYTHYYDLIINDSHPAHGNSITFDCIQFILITDSVTTVH